MPAGRPRTPTNVLALRGALDRDKGRHADRAAEPAPRAPIGDPPAHMSVGGAACWREIVGVLPDGVGFDSDRAALEQFAEDLAHCRAYCWQISDKKGAQMMRHYAAFGMTPSDRSRIKVDKPKAAVVSPRSEFSKGKAA